MYTYENVPRGGRFRCHHQCGMGAAVARSKGICRTRKRCRPGTVRCARLPGDRVLVRRKPLPGNGYERFAADESERVIACDRWPLSEPEPRCYNRACFTVNIP